MGTGIWVVGLGLGLGHLARGRNLLRASLNAFDGPADNMQEGVRGIPGLLRAWQPDAGGKGGW